MGDVSSVEAAIKVSYGGGTKALWPTLASVQAAISTFAMIDNDTLLINFEDNPSKIEYNITSSPKKLYYRKESGISAGAIVAIILIPIVVLGLIIGIIYFIRNKNIRKTDAPESSATKINITNKV